VAWLCVFATSPAEWAHGCIHSNHDSSSQQLFPDRIKLMTSDSDYLSVREMYGKDISMCVYICVCTALGSKEMLITWKLALACNNVPPTDHEQ
jgi:hypothetical protein